ncbi:hypothetical protein T484DRAFT_1822381, partial [Baffinella frigidus]
MAAALFPGGIRMWAYWCDALACSNFLPAFAHPWVLLFGRDEVLACEACVMFALNWSRAWFQYWPSPPLHTLGAVDRLLYAQDPLLVKALVSARLSSKDYAWPLLRSMLSEVLDHASWLRFMDHVLVSPPERILLLIVAFLHHHRVPLLCVTDLAQLNVFLEKPHHVEVASLLSITRKMEQSGKMRSLLAQAGMADTAPLSQQAMRFLGAATDGGAYPMLTDFPRAAVEHHVQQYMELRDAEEQYLRQRKYSADLEAHARTLKAREDGVREEDALLEQARQEQARQLEAMSRERRNRAQMVEERARLTRLEQVRLLAQQEEDHRETTVARQKKVLGELDAQLAARAREDEMWLQRRLEAERLQQVEFETAMQLQKSVQARQTDGQAAMLQSEVDARRRLLEVKKSTAEQRWAVEDLQ